MLLPHLDFILVPDRAAARRLQRKIARAGSRTGVVVGVWPTLAEMAASAYLVRPPEGSWIDTLRAAMGASSDWFWSKSFSLAPKDTATTIAASLQLLIEGAGPDADLPSTPPVSLALRAASHYGDLIALWDQTGRALPSPLDAVCRVLDTPGTEAMSRIRVHVAGDIFLTSPWQRALIGKLNVDSASGMESQANTLFRGHVTPRAPSETAAGHCQRMLFAVDPGRLTLDHSLQILRVRDPLEEIEIVAGMIQESLRAGERAGNIGLLMPNDPFYYASTRDIFAKIGIPVAGLPSARKIRDLGREAVQYFLMRFEGPAPAMALASLLSSPLMPWNPDAGAKLAADIIGGRFDMKPPKNFSATGNAMLDLIRQAGPDTDLRQTLKAFVAVIGGGPTLAPHRERLRAAVAAVLDAIPASGGVPWDRLRPMIMPEDIHEESGDTLSIEGVAVFLEHEEPWRDIEHLYVLGFSSGRYPSVPSPSAVFSEIDLAQIREALGLRFDLASDTTTRRRDLFVRQIGAASKVLVFLIPGRDAGGTSISPSETLTFLAQPFLTLGRDDIESIILDLDHAESRGRIQGLAKAASAAPAPPRLVTAPDLALDRDLTEGFSGSESPTRLETLIVSPLAWLLGRLDVEQADWAPESVDPITQGIIAHYVFEQIFSPKLTFPDEETLPGLVNEHLATAIQARMPLLAADTWKVERKNLERSILDGVRHWHLILTVIKGQTIANEIRLAGTLAGIPIKGSADALIALPENRLYVADFKKSSSTRRRTSMRAGWDIQASLYREMLKTGELDPKTPEATAAAIKSARDIGVLYYTINDRFVLADTNGWTDGRVPRFKELATDISGSAMDALKARLLEIRKGVIALNRQSDRKFFSDKGIGTYALEENPLIARFTLPALESKGEEDST